MAVFPSAVIEVDFLMNEEYRLIVAFSLIATDQ
jgi:hypothetical protein